MRHYLIFIPILFVCSPGCDTAARQQEAENARRQQIANELRAIGTEMHNNHSDESSNDSAATDHPPESPESASDDAGNSE